MNHRMEREMERTIQVLQASMPGNAGRRTSIFTLLPIAAGEMNPALLAVLFAGELLLGMAGSRALAMPMAAVFCTAPMPMLLLFHLYVLHCSGGMRELEETFPYSYGEMLLARSALISWYMLGTLCFLAAVLHRSAGESFLRLALCGAVPGIYLSALLLFLSRAVRNPETLSMIATVFWAALCSLAVLLPFDQLLRICSTAVYGLLAALGLLLYGVCSFMVKTRRFWYVAGIG